MTDDDQSHRLGLFALLIPGGSLIVVGLLSDIARGGKLITDWGTGQTLLLCLGAVTAALGFSVHGKALSAELSGVRHYQRTVAFILTPMLAMVLLPLLLAELACRMIPEPDDTNASYRQSDPVFGFSLAPDRQYRVVSRPKQFEILVRIDNDGFRRGANGKSVSVADANVAVIGDSHPFGFAIAENETLPSQLERMLADAKYNASVLNAGVPGFGLGQSLLKLQSISQLQRGSVIVLFVNPLNDLVNLSSAVDYHYPKPHAVLDDGKLVFRSAPEDWGEGPFLFSQPFDSLNTHFGLADQRKIFHSALLRRWRYASTQPSVIDGIVQLVDETPLDVFAQNDETRIADQPLLYASRYWPEMPQFANEREILHELVAAVFDQIADTAKLSGWNLVVVIAPEAFEHQTYGKRYLELIRKYDPDDRIAGGWARNAAMAAAQKSGLDVIAPNYPSEELGGPLDSYFVHNDDHTSAKGHQMIAELVTQWIVDHRWLAEQE